MDYADFDGFHGLPWLDLSADRLARICNAGLLFQAFVTLSRGVGFPG